MRLGLFECRQTFARSIITFLLLVHGATTVPRSLGQEVHFSPEERLDVIDADLIGTARHSSRDPRERDLHAGPSADHGRKGRQEEAAGGLSAIGGVSSGDHEFSMAGAAGAAAWAWASWVATPMGVRT